MTLSYSQRCTQLRNEPAALSASQKAAMQSGLGVVSITTFGVRIMSIVYIFETKYVCRLAPEGGWILNAYTPISFN